MNTSHTPGPWEWDDDAIFSSEPIDFESHAPWLCAKGITTPVLRGEIMCSDPANARLIAAAPDLLEALILLQHEMIESGNARSTDYGWKPAIEKTSAAIAKATGAA